MQIDYPITVLSDLHVGHPASYLTDPAQLAPLFQDAATVVFNGDSVEMLWLCNRDRAQQQLERLAQACLEQGARPVFLNGNHDPVVSSANYLDLCNGAVLVTHGDILFHEIAPWSREAKILGPEHTRILETMDHDARTDFEERLVAAKRVSLMLEMHEPRTSMSRWAGLRTAVREGWPPWRALRIIHYWMQTPGLAHELVERYRLPARFVVIGHTHYAGVWKRGDRVVVNTGSYLPLSGRLAVRISPDRFEVCKVVWEKGQWRFGRILDTYPLMASPAYP